MIPGRIEDVDKGVIEALIENEVRENKSIEYKQEFPGRADSDAVPFLAGVSSLANASGGDLLLGVKAIKGVPVEAPGIRISDVDAEKLRLEHMLLNGVEPRLPRIDIEEIEIDAGAYVLVVRVPDSWSAPHRVKRNSKFYARNSAGRYELDVGELRTAFAMSEAVSSQIRDFRADRLAKILGRETPVPLLEGGCMAVHIVPLNAFRATTEVAMSAIQAHNNQIRPMDSAGSGYSVLINLDGFVTSVVRPPNESDTYAQMFRNGAVEAASVLGEERTRHYGPSQRRVRKGNSEFRKRLPAGRGESRNRTTLLRVPILRRSPRMPVRSQPRNSTGIGRTNIRKGHDDPAGSGHRRSRRRPDQRSEAQIRHGLERLRIHSIDELRRARELGGAVEARKSRGAMTAGKLRVLSASVPIDAYPDGSASSESAMAHERRSNAQSVALPPHRARPPEG